MKEYKLSNWTIEYKGKKIPAKVPGDITIDFLHANLIANPYFALNYQECAWIGRTDFTYEYELEVSEEMLKEESIELVFKGIDLFSDIYVNGTLLGHTKNMFLLYKYQIKEYLKVGKNLIEVKMKSTLNAADKIDTTGYYSIFNDPRIFLRKTQCHFGWDWAPKICGYGIWDDAYIQVGSKYQIENVRIITDLEGGVSFQTTLNYNTRVLMRADGSIAKAGEPYLGDTLKYYVSKTPNGNDFEEVEVPVTGMKNIAGIVIENPKLWWPIGYGEHPLYNYRIELVRDGKVTSVKEGKLAFRTVQAKEKPVDKDKIGFTFYINNEPVFIKGSNWVPIECFTGAVEDEKYEALLNLAKEHNFNTIRVWGGGMYEKDKFYDICDELGLLVWQDMCFACADIPEENQEFVDNTLQEIEYQIIRLRNHPSIIYWCGGNEKTGCYGLAITHGDFFVNNLLYGFIMNLDDTRPYRRQSPYSLTDIGNDKTSGESHHNCFEMALLNNGMMKYRESLAQNIVPFVSECAVMGPCSLEGMKKIFPKENLWPMDYMWKDRFMENPYGSVPMDFPHREAEYAKQLYGEATSLEDFIPKGMMAHAEALRAEADYTRAHKGQTSGFLNWMFDDIWPSGTWSIVDYFLEPKQAFYQLGKCYQSKYVSFYVEKNGKTNVFAVNDTLDVFDLPVKVEQKTYDGKVINTMNVSFKGLSNKKAQKMELDFEVREDCYLVATYLDTKTLYSPNFYSHVPFTSEYEYKVVESTEHKLVLEFTAKTFVKSLFMHFENNGEYIYS
ncbi:MAG: hypothetical protein MJ248_06800, partial [Bacilli bacterium]|nr:hypothetical protein [Bacilli bacterium]